MTCFISLIVTISLLGFCQAKIATDLMEVLSSGSRSNVLIEFHGSNTEAIESIDVTTFTDRVEQIEALTSALKVLRAKTQEEIEDLLSGEDVAVTSFWISNQMILRNASREHIEAVAAFGQVSSIEFEPVIQLPPLEVEEDVENDESLANATDIKAENQWGVDRIKAVEVWKESRNNNRGQTVVVANIDTGVRWTHEILKQNYRGRRLRRPNRGRSWYDPYTHTVKPDDGNGHGTHTMGTIVGRLGYGVAPRARWIACRGLEANGSGRFKELLLCAQWMVEPTWPDGKTKPRAAYAPHIVSNSWGGSPGVLETTFRPAINAWTKAGILSVWAIGNEGDLGCNTTGSPGNLKEAFSVGATDIEDRLAFFSSKGPTPDGRIKPEVVAPGVNIKSAWFDGNFSYKTISGTSMATPHVAGLEALVLRALRLKRNNRRAKLSQARMVEIIENTAVRTELSPPKGVKPCGANSNTFPNNAFGHGLVNAKAAVAAVKQL